MYACKPQNWMQFRKCVGSPSKQMLILQMPVHSVCGKFLAGAHGYQQAQWWLKRLTWRLPIPALFYISLLPWWTGWRVSKCPAGFRRNFEYQQCWYRSHALGSIITALTDAPIIGRPQEPHGLQSSFAYQWAGINFNCPGELSVLHRLIPF